MKRAELIDALIKCEDRQQVQNTCLNVGEDPYGVDKVNPVIKSIFKASFMKELTYKAKKYCKIGHKNKRPVCEELLCHSTGKR